MSTTGSRLLSPFFLPPERRRIGYVFQDYALFPHLSVCDNVCFGMRRPTAQRGLELLGRVGLAPLADRMPADLSGGEQQRVALARALAQEPNFMLLDEPFSNLDKTLRRDLRRKTIELLSDAQVTSVLVTHDAEEALALADRISVLHAGRLHQTGAGEDLYLRPKTREVALSLGEAIFFDVTSRQDGVVVCELGTVPVRGAQASGKLLLRPEQLRLRPTSSPNRPPARVLERRFLGPTVELRLSIGNCVLTARMPADVAPQTPEGTVEVIGEGWVLPV